MKKMIIISGSRNPEGQTAKAVDAVLWGARKAGVKGETMYLPLLNIARCRQCEDSGWGTCRKKGKCKIDDDFDGLVEKIKDSDAVVFATPVYYRDLSESLRSFLDRLRRICTHDSGKKGINGKAAVGICVAGGSGNGAPECAAIMTKVLSTIGFDVVDMISVRRQNLDMKISVLKITGRWLANTVKSG